MTLYLHTMTTKYHDPLIVNRWASSFTLLQYLYNNRNNFRDYAVKKFEERITNGNASNFTLAEIDISNDFSQGLNNKVRLE